MTDTTTLAPCPFCGGCAVHFHYSGSACVGCKDCIAYLGGEESDLKPDALAEAWNRRAPAPAPTDDLQKRCAEIIGWHRTGVLVGDTLRSHAESKWPGVTHKLRVAERATENEALCFIAKWGAPAPVAEDAANGHWLASYLVGPRTDLDDEIVASESVNDLRKLVSAARARAQAAQPEGGA